MACPASSSVQLCYCGASSLHFPQFEGDRHCAQAADVPSQQGQACRHSGLSWLLPASVFRDFLYLSVPIEEDGKSKHELVATELNKH